MCSLVTCGCARSLKCLSLTDLTDLSPLPSGATQLIAADVSLPRRERREAFLPLGSVRSLRRGAVIPALPIFSENSPSICRSSLHTEGLTSLPILSVSGIFFQVFCIWWWYCFPYHGENRRWPQWLVEGLLAHCGLAVVSSWALRSLPPQPSLRLFLCPGLSHTLGGGRLQSQPALPYSCPSGGECAERRQHVSF